MSDWIIFLENQNALGLWYGNVMIYNSTCINYKPLNRILILGNYEIEDI